jgi:CarD family transcriptional regulator
MKVSAAAAGSGRGTAAIKAKSAPASANKSPVKAESGATKKAGPARTAKIEPAKKTAREPAAAKPKPAKSPVPTVAETAPPSLPEEPIPAEPVEAESEAALADAEERSSSPAPVPESPEPEPAVAEVVVEPVAEGATELPPRPAPPPRLPAKPDTFVEGDHVVYPTHGVGKVDRIATEDIAGHRLELIHITFEENRMTLRVPVTKARSAGLRKLATRKIFDEALAILKGRARIKRTMWSRRAQEYEAKINSGDPLAIAEVVRDLHRNAGQPDQSFSERQIYEAAMDRLAAELAALDKTDKATAANKLSEFLKTV